METAKATDEFLSKFIDSLVSGGKMTLSAAGSKTYQYICQVLNPRAIAAYRCPRGKDSMPALNCSAILAEVNNPSAITTNQKEENCCMTGNIFGNTKYHKKI